MLQIERSIEPCPQGMESFQTLVMLNFNSKATPSRISAHSFPEVTHQTARCYAVVTRRTELTDF